MISTNISFAFLKRLRSMPSWSEMAYAFDNCIVPVKTVIDYAKEKVSANNSATLDETAIANASMNDSIADNVRNLSESDVLLAEDVTKLRWANILLAWSYENRASYRDFLGVVEEIYSDLDYPYELAPFVRYMPSNLPNLGSPEANEQRIIASIGDYTQDLVDS